MATNNQGLTKDEILIYSPIYSYTAEWLVREINTFADDAQLTLRLHTPGGGVIDGYAMLSRLSDRTGGTDVFVDGMAYSMGAYIALYGGVVIANEASKFMFHKAAYPSWYEPNEIEQQGLKDINAALKAKMIARLNDSVEAKELIKKVFEPDVRNDVYLSAKEAKKIGLVTEIRPLDLSVKARMDEEAKISAYYTEQSFDNQHKNNTFEPIKTTSKMTFEQIKAEHPAVFAQIIAIGEASGTAKEKDRVGSYLAFMEAAPEAVKAGIASGNAMSETQRSEFAMAAFKAMANHTETTEQTAPVTTAAAPTTDVVANQYEAELEASLTKQGLTLKA